jgi:hypothetical protein
MTASVFRVTDGSNTDIDYPAFEINATIGDGPSVNPVYMLFRGGLGYQVLNSTDEAALLAAIQSFFSTYEWTGDQEGYSLHSFSVTEYTETSTDVTP